MKLTLSLILVTLITSCSNSTNATRRVTVSSGSEWQDKAADEITALCEVGTPKYEWEKLAATGDAKSIQNISELVQVLDRYREIDSAERESLLSAYDHATQAVYYNFEGNFRSLVFFDEHNQTTKALLMGN